MLAAMLMGATAVVASVGGGKPKHIVVFMLTDDQDIELGGLTPMAKTRELLGEQGAVGATNTYTH